MSPVKREGFSVSLYYKLFLVFGVTFLVIFWVLSNIPNTLKSEQTDLWYLTGPVSEDQATRWNNWIGHPIDLQKVRKIELGRGVKAKIVGESILWEPKFTTVETDDTELFALELIGCAILILASVLIVKRLLLPLATLTDDVRKYADGQFQIRSKVVSGDEMGLLAGSFNAMADKIKGQIDALKQLAVGISHEIRSPLARMNLLIEKVSDARLKDSLRSNLNEIDSITEGVLEREKLNAGISELRIEPLDLESLLVELTGYYRKSGHQVRLTCPPGMTISADRRRLEMCIKNVVDNSFRHAGEGGPVEVMASTDENEVCSISVHDFGGKMAGEQPQARGFGLGLKLCESIARAHGGDLEIKKQPDGGMMTNLTFPRMGKAPPRRE